MQDYFHEHADSYDLKVSCNKVKYLATDAVMWLLHETHTIEWVGPGTYKYTPEFDPFGDESVGARTCHHWLCNKQAKLQCRMCDPPAVFCSNECGKTHIAKNCKGTWIK